ncbi:pentapeptide repeat-containing protein [Cyanobacterium aponinum]|uniref:NERD domain protein n=1 Tax=Cyanobacterium aponinum (strain PCC 10605) TaxID=755178 RepID=K9Z892_CYAAP|nr:pentapeptide repeat-containing protein [Cyanobacterium aponinum]AFZ54795.1 NERD domain protein [Cyanobacterium aponinum PCC 10605]
MTDIDLPKSCFIATEKLDNKGEKGEYLVWQSIKNIFVNHDILAYWRYPLFNTKNQRKEPDILIFEKKIGVIIIEVKAINIEQIVSINGHLWQYKNFYTNQGNPYQQAENQLFNVLDYFSTEPSLSQQIKGRVLIALPFIKSKAWQEKGFDKLPSNPPIIFANDLLNLDSLKEKIINTSTVVKGRELDSQQWKILLSIITGKSVIIPPTYRVLTKDNSRGKIINKLINYYYHLDLKQEIISKKNLNAVEGIKGTAGTGKTLLLCQKAAYFHLKYPEWKIAFIFFSRSLYEQIITLIDKWLRHFSNNKIGYNTFDKNLLILHGWGNKNQEGFYSLICHQTKSSKLRVNDTYSQSPNDSLAEVCCQLLENKKIPALFDLIILDEAQDFLSSRWLFQGKQPFLYLVYNALAPNYINGKERKKLIYAYDEIQCLNQIGETYQRGLFADILPSNHPSEKIYTLTNSYRTPKRIINTAFAINMGWCRPLGVLTMIKSAHSWQEMGYKLRGNLQSNNNISIERKNHKYIHPLDNFDRGEIINFQSFYSRQEELNYLAEKILYNLRYDGLRPSRQILVIVLGNGYESQIIENQCRDVLERNAISVYFPHQDNSRQFWQDGAVTVCNVYQAKGNEAFLVYIIGCDRIAKEEDNISLRNQLFVALTRSKGWVYLSGVGNYVMYSELKEVLAVKGDSFNLTLRNLPENIIKASEKEDLLKRFALGNRNFKYLCLSGESFKGCCLDNINLIGSNLEKINFQQTSLEKAKFINADLKDVDFRNANLKNAKFIGANLTRVNFDGANLTNVDFSDTKMI